jgi:hypothetical protein
VFHTPLVLALVALKQPLEQIVLFTLSLLRRVEVMVINLTKTAVMAALVQVLALVHLLVLLPNQAHLKHTLQPTI